MGYSNCSDKLNSPTSPEEFKELKEDLLKGMEPVEVVKTERRKYKWENTNYMLRQHNYNGLKTGITEAAGPCVSASYEKDGNNLIIILLSSKSMEARWQEVPLLVNWAINKSYGILPENTSAFQIGNYNKKENNACF